MKGDIVAKKRDKFYMDNDDGDEIDVDVNEEGNGDDNKTTDNKYVGVNDFDIEVIDDVNIDKYTLYDVLIPIFGGKLNVPDTFNLHTYLTDLLSADALDKAVFEKL